MRSSILTPIFLLLLPLPAAAIPLPFASVTAHQRRQPLEGSLETPLLSGANRHSEMDRPGSPTTTAANVDTPPPAEANKIEAAPAAAAAKIEAPSQALEAEAPPRALGNGKPPSIIILDNKGPPPSKLAKTEADSLKPGEVGPPLTWAQSMRQKYKRVRGAIRRYLVALGEDDGWPWPF